MPEVVNVVASGTLGRELDIRAVGEDIIATKISHQSGDYKTPTAYIREREDGPLVVVYETGSYHISGARSVDEAEVTWDWFVGELERIGVGGLDVSFAVRNVVVAGDLGREIDLNKLVVELGVEKTEYEPEQFPGLIYRPKDPDCVFLIFGSGKVVVVGATSVEGAFEAFDWLSDQVQVEQEL